MEITMITYKLRRPDGDSLTATVRIVSALQEGRVGLKEEVRHLTEEAFSPKNVVAIANHDRVSPFSYDAFDVIDVALTRRSVEQVDGEWEVITTTTVHTYKVDYHTYWGGAQYHTSYTLVDVS